MSWQIDAKCSGMDPDVFFPVGTTLQAIEKVAHAKNICSECMVVTDCLDWAISTNQDSGIWGGKSEEERRVLRRQLPKKTRRRLKI
ncbi:MAG: WhiB family transcriptional regulator [Bifidobacteriaceae bacterium]|jgi:WhiB family redox-sensing transcriptional regulator|nr:WhiB family transcriptional regulator [Bifidobacteriaceae bacterium]